MTLDRFVIHVEWWQYDDC